MPELHDSMVSPEAAEATRRLLERWPVSESVVVRPGDTLIIRVRPDVTRAEFDEFYRGIKERFDDECPGAGLLIVAAEQLAVYKSDAADHG